MSFAGPGPMPHYAEGTLSGVSDGQIILQLGQSAKIHMYVDEGNLQQAIWLHAKGKPQKGSGVNYDFTASGSSITGELSFGEKSYTIDASVSGAAVSGSFSGSESGSIAGEVKTWEAIESAEDPITGAQWPYWAGPNYNWKAGDGHTLVATLANARPIWRSEEVTPAGLGSISRYAAGCKPLNPIGGGACSPIVAEGRVYLFYHVADGKVIDAGKLSNCASEFEAVRDQYGQKAYDEQFRRFSIGADDVVLCLDARSGRRIWKKVFVGKGANWQDHKGGYNNNTPVYGDGKIYAIGSTNRVYCLDALTGDSVWESSLEAKHEYLEAKKVEYLASGRGGNPFFSTGRDQTAPGLYLDGLFIMSDYSGGVIALDGETGEKVWRTPNIEENGLALWRHAGKKYLLTFSGNHMVCIDPSNQGAIVWTSPASRYVSQGLGVYENFAAYYNGDPQGGNGISITGGRLDSEGFHPEWTVPLAQTSSYHTPIITNAYVYASAHDLRKTLCIDRMSGAVLKESGIHVASNGHLQMIEDRLLVTGDNHHGNGDFGLVKPNESNFGQMGVYWEEGMVPHWCTSPYSNAPFAYAYAGGRLFIRGCDGVYAYDLRAQDRPAVRLTSPANNSSITTIDSMDITAVVENGSVEKVIFLADGHVIGEDDQAPYSVRWGSNKRGWHRLCARIEGVADEGRFSEVILVQVDQAPCLEKPAAASSSFPADGAADVSVFTEFQWHSAQSGRDVATSYILYLGAAPNPPVVDTLTEIEDTTFWYGALEGNTTYYWRIDAVNGCGKTPGDVWNFTTHDFLGFRYLKLQFEASGSLNARVHEARWLADGSEYPMPKASAGDGALTVEAPGASESASEWSLIYDGDYGTNASFKGLVYVTLDLGENYAIMPDSLHIKGGSGSGRNVDKVSAYGSEDGITWYRLYENVWEYQDNTVPLIPSGIVNFDEVKEKGAFRESPVSAKASIMANRQALTCELALPAREQITLDVYDLQGKRLMVHEAIMDKGFHTFSLPFNNVNVAQALIWRLQTSAKIMNGHVINMH